MANTSGGCRPPGRDGVELTLADGRRVFVGSRRPGELQRALAAAGGR